MPSESYKFLGILSIAIAVAAAWYLVKTWPKGRGSSLSRHAGAHKTAYWIFMAVLVGDGLLFYLFMLKWFVPAMHLAAGYTVLLTLGYALQVGTAFIPDRADGSRLSRSHGLVAFSMAGVMELLTTWLVFADGVSVPARLLAGIGAGWMTFFWLLFVFVKSTHRFFLVYQTLYIASFYVCILAATYIR
jgi:hypothetical protein